MLRIAKNQCRGVEVGEANSNLVIRAKLAETCIEFIVQRVGIHWLARFREHNGPCNAIHDLFPYAFRKM